MESPFVRFLYSNAFGRICLKILQHSGLLKLAARFMRSRVSKIIIKPFIKNNKIDMTEFAGQKYNNYQEFFSRKRSYSKIDSDDTDLISPCDGYLSIYPIEKDSCFHVKDSYYKMSDLIPDEKTAKLFEGGDCIIFRLCGNDYHRYIYIDDAYVHTNNYIEGELHSVQPIACDLYPVYRLNRRVWTLMETKNFGSVVQIEVGALLVGGIVNHHENKNVLRGEEMGYFDLAGSTIMMFFQKDRITINERFQSTENGYSEIRVKQGEHIGQQK